MTLKFLKEDVGLRVADGLRTNFEDVLDMVTTSAAVLLGTTIVS